MNNKLKIAIESVIPEMVKEWNEVKLPIFEKLYEQSFSEYFKGRQTQEKTKCVAPCLDSIFARLIEGYIPEFKIDETVGRDYKWGDEGYECKITLGETNGWTGNGYAKTPNHILLRFTMNEDGMITHMFASLVDLNKCESRWTDPTTTSNFSTLSFLKEDVDMINVIIGDIKINRKFIAPINCRI